VTSISPYAQRDRCVVHDDSKFENSSFDPMNFGKISNGNSDRLGDRLAREHAQPIILVGLYCERASLHFSHESKCEAVCIGFQNLTVCLGCQSIRSIASSKNNSDKSNSSKCDKSNSSNRSLHRYYYLDGAHTNTILVITIRPGASILEC
jgi:hypothetical protein